MKRQAKRAKALFFERVRVPLMSNQERADQLSGLIPQRPDGRIGQFCPNH